MKIFVLIDRSASMAGNRWPEFLGSISAMFKERPEDEFAVYAFDGSVSGMSFDVVRMGKGHYQSAITAQVLQPRGQTPLNDALVRFAEAIKLATNIEAAIVPHMPCDKVQAIIVTDGDENASREFMGVLGRQRARDAILGLKARGVDVVWMGANYGDVVRQAESYGVDEQSTIYAMATQAGYHNATKAVMMRTANFAAGTVAANQASFTAEERAAAKAQ